MTSISLTKGDTISLMKQQPGLKKVFVGAGWDMSDSGKTMDADLSVFALNDSLKSARQKDFVYFGNKSNTNNSIEHSSDNLTGEGDGDDEVININLDKLPADITTIDVVLTIYDAAAKGQDLSQLSNAFVRIVNAENTQEIAKFEIGKGMHGDTLAFGKLTKDSDGWHFKADGPTSKVGLQGLLKQYDTEAAKAA